VPWLKPEPDGGEGDGDDAEDDGARHFARGEPRDHQEPCHGEQDLHLRKIAEGDEGRGVARDDPRVLQADQGEKQANAGGDAELQI
jgi:hypothetical protein